MARRFGIGVLIQVLVFVAPFGVIVGAGQFGDEASGTVADTRPFSGRKQGAAQAAVWVSRPWATPAKKVRPPMVMAGWNSLISWVRRVSEPRLELEPGSDVSIRFTRGSLELRACGGAAVDGAEKFPQTSKLATPVKTDDGDITEAISKITWTADANSAIKPHQFQEFDVSLGPLPETDQIVFKALQTYSDGDVVRWIDEPAAGAEPEHPAPVLKLTKASSTTDAHGATSSVAAQDAAATANDGADSSDGTTITLAVLGLVLGLAGLVAGLLAYRRAGHTT